MKKSIVAVLAIGLLLSFGSIAMAGMAAGTGIDGTYHDLSSHGAAAAFGEAADQTGLNRICVYCHAPHNTNKAAAGLNAYRPLWNHDASANTTFTMYSNGTDVPNQVMHQSQAMTLLAGVMAPGSVSMLCLSCHDGTTATNSYGYAANTGASKGTGGNTLVGTRAEIGGGLAADLSNHHPIGFNYDLAQAADPELELSANPGYLAGAAGVTPTGANGPKTIADLLWAGNVECVSCHDVHNTQNSGSKFTWIEDQNSALCLTCHLKGVPNPL